MSLPKTIFNTFTNHFSPSPILCEDGGIRYDKGCAMDHKTVCRNSMEKCENFYPITKIFESTCDTCGTNLCNDHNHEGQDPPDNRKGSEGICLCNSEKLKRVGTKIGLKGELDRENVG